MSAGSASTLIQDLYFDHHGWLKDWLRRRLGNAFDAADLAQDTFVRVLVSGRTPSPEQGRAHLAQIAKGLVVDLHRRRVLEAAYLEALAQLPEAMTPSPEASALAVEALLLLDAALGRLKPKAREAFLLSQLDGLSYPAIAERLDISVAAVRKYMMRAAEACHAVSNPSRAGA